MKKLLPLLLPAAVLALASCSSEPSDWRPGTKVSLEMIPPGTRPSDNFNLTPENSPEASKGGAIPRPVNSGMKSVLKENVSAATVMSADTQDGTAMPQEETSNAQNGGAKKPGATDASGAPGSAGAAEPVTTQPEAQPK